MWRTFAILALVAFLLVSVGGNVVLFQQAASNRAEADRLLARARETDGERARLQGQVDQLTSDLNRARTAGPTPAPALPAVPAPVPTAAPTRAPATQPTPAASGSPDRGALQRIEAQVARIRGLQPTADVPLKVMDQQALRTYFTESFERDYLPEERESDQKLLVALGLMEPGVDLVKVYLDLLQDQVLGLYNDDEKAMYVISSSAFGPGERATYAHEFVHALQDQAYGLRQLVPKHGGNDDRSLAVHALIEGDASLAQVLWMQQNLTRDEFAQATQGGQSTVLEAAPRVLREELLFPYVDGLEFVLQAYRQGGYPAVSQLFQEPPASTEQVLHPEKYRAREAPVDVALPDLAAAMGPGWRTIDGNTMGELDLGILLRQYGDESLARQAAAGWGGDRWALLEKDGRASVVVKTTWDTDADASEFFAALTQGLQRRFPGAPAAAATSTRQALTASEWATEVRRNGRDILLVIAPDSSSASGLANAVGGF